MLARQFLLLVLGSASLGVPLLKAQQSPIPDRTNPMPQPYVQRADTTGGNHAGLQAGIPEDITKLPLAPGFLLALNVIDEPDLAGSFRVDQKGDLTLPVLGDLHVSGLTVPETAVLIRKRLVDEKYMRDPQVMLNLVEYTATQVTILGEVVSPGKYPLLTQHSLVQVLALAGGLSPLAGKEVEVIHAGSPIPETIEYSRDSAYDSVAAQEVQPGDTVRVKRAGVVYVMGAVARPGGYVMQESGTLNVLQAISLASGTSPAAKTNVVHILRPNDDGSVVDIPLALQRLMEGKTAPVSLQAKDIVYVPTSKIKSVFQNSSAILSSVASATIYTIR